jgi:VIT1/CCC1 family predicted Fe2+/Mn2+ transporter
MEQERLARIKAGVVEEGRQLLVIFLYLWVLLTLFSLHKAVIFNEDLLTYQQGLALINALALAKIILIGQKLHLGEPNRDAPVAVPALIKAAIFGLLLVAFHVVEETLIGVFHGKTVREAIPTIGDGSLQAILMTAIIATVGLIPFFAFVELERVLGTDELRTLLFGRRRARNASGEHVERHFLNSETVRDVVIGMADGLTVPFALAAGISAAIASTRVVVTAGLAEIVAGATAMGLGGYLAARSDQEHFHSEEKREYAEVEKLPDQERRELREIFAQYGLEKPEVDTVVSALSADKKRWVDFMMRFELGLERPDPKRAPVSAATIAAAYAIGGLIPLAPYIVEDDIRRALLHSALFTGVALLVFGAVKGRLTGADPVKSGLQTFLVGGLAAGAAYYLASLFG